MGFVAFSLGNAVGTQFWLDKYKPDNRIPWVIVLISSSCAIACTFAQRTLYARENRKRDSMKREALRAGTNFAVFEEYMMVETTDSDGKVHQRKVDKMYLDLTDGENLAFRYVL